MLKRNLTINKEKSRFFVNETVYLGMIISEQGIKPDMSRIATFENCEIKNKKSLQKILGFINYFRAFIPNLARKTAELYDLLKKESKFILDDKEKKYQKYSRKTRFSHQNFSG